MYFQGSTTTSTGFAQLAREAETIIERLEFEINGQIVNGGCSQYNQLWSIIADSSIGEDAANRLSVLQNATDQAIPTANMTNQQFVIQNYLGFWGSAKPSVLDSNLLGNCRLRITLAQNSILTTRAAATNAQQHLLQYRLYLNRRRNFL
jgi:hypothetical protein